MAGGDGLLDLTAHELASEIEAGGVSAGEAAEVANARVGEVEGDVNAFLRKSAIRGSGWAVRSSSRTYSVRAA
jgi:Asp-tRNA(Asn)/Glu-tRNA(Gln) amidotransferase A subunit family amidase